MFLPCFRVPGLIGDVNQVMRSGAIYAATSSGPDTITVTVTDGHGGNATQSTQFNPLAPAIDGELTDGQYEIFVVDRAGGTAGLVIEDASLTRGEDMYQGSFAVHLDVTAADGSPRGSVEARVVGTHPITDTDYNDVRTDLYDLTKRLMSSMNVELEFQINRDVLNSLQVKEAELQAK